MILNSIQLVYTKIKVKNPEESKKIQNRAFDIGFFWPYTEGKRVPIHTDSKYIFFNSIYMSQSNDLKFFKSQSEHVEITMADLFGKENLQTEIEEELQTKSLIINTTLYARYELEKNHIYIKVYENIIEGRKQESEDYLIKLISLLEKVEIKMASYLNIK